MDWSKLDPNVVVVLATGLGTLITTIYGKLRGKQTESRGGIVESVVGNLMIEWLEKFDITSKDDLAKFLNTVRDDVEKRIWGILAKRGVPKIPAVVQLVHAALEEGTRKLGNEIAARRIPFQLREIHERLSDAQEKLRGAS